MTVFKRCFTKKEAEEIRPYLNYHGEDIDLDTLYICLEKGFILRSPLVEKLAKNYKVANPDGVLPKCLKL
jgi:hypothetical protein